MAKFVEVSPAALTLLTFLVLVSYSTSTLVQMAARTPVPGKQSPPGSPWPLPQSWSQSEDMASLGSAADFKYASNVDCELLSRAFSRYNHAFLTRGLLNPQVDEALAVLNEVLVVLPETNNFCENYPRLNVSGAYEEYSLTVQGSLKDPTVAVAIISAHTVWGGLRGLETFSQLVWQDRDWSTSRFYVNFTEIVDYPRFPHRGFMIDSARHFLAPNVILEVLDGMAYNKFNVLHWHVVDDQSWPFVSRKFPELSEKGAFIPGILDYKPETVAHIIEEARLRGIRVVLEFDTPGHTYAVGKSHQELLTPCYGDGKTPGTANYPRHAAYENLDPTREVTYEFMRELLTEVAEDVIRDEYVHLGMDEIYYPCWESSPIIKQFMEDHNYTEMNQVQEHYNRRIVEMAREIGVRPIVWQDPIEHDVDLPKDVLVQVWKSPFGGHAHPWEYYLKMVVSKGYNTLLSACWYVNYLKYGQTWQEYYNCDPVLSLKGNYTLTPEEAELILGGEAAIWGEYVDTTNIIARIFPYIGAVAEKLWSAPNASSVADAAWRLDEHRCRFLGRGIRAQPLMTSYCFPEELNYNYVRTGSDQGV